MLLPFYEIGSDKNLFICNVFKVLYKTAKSFPIICRGQKISFNFN